ncbi:MAG TPA: TIGR03663 family protein [Candidatus Brocadiia bacterium]|nr:TIGR03663 family protein [Candidatus Brocadiia bacterium]
MTRRWTFRVLMAAALAGAVALRIIALDARPMHGDEAVNTIKFRYLYDLNEYRYDPDEYHGPSLYYLSFIPMWLSGAGSFAQTGETVFRSLPAVLGALMIPFLFLFAKELGRWIVLYAAMLAAVSPAMVFYSRYYIHETLLIFFTLLVIGGCWRYYRSRDDGWLLLAGLGAGLMHATKETCVVAFAAMAGALFLTHLWNRRFGGVTAEKFRPDRRYVVAAVLLGAGVSAVLFSSLLSNPRGPLDSVLTYFRYFHHAGARDAHVHPWNFYLKLLLYNRHGDRYLWSEAFILVMALTGAYYAFSPRILNGDEAPLCRFLAFYTILLLAAYSAIPYKTPWCALGPLQGMVLLGGVGAVSLVRAQRTVPRKDIIRILMAAGIANLLAQTYLLNFRFHTDRRNPYVYGHPVHDVEHLYERVEEVASVSPERHNLTVKVIAPDYWPLPWYLRKFDNVGFWTNPPADSRAAIILLAPEYREQLLPVLEKEYHEEYFGLRPELFILCYIRTDLWDALIERRSASPPPAAGNAK